MSVLPTLLVGLGNSGLNTLNQIASFLPVSYGYDALSKVGMLNFSFTGADKLVNGVKQCLISHDSQLLRDRMLIRQIPLFNQWLDIDYYTGVGRSNRQDTNYDRQIGRFVLLEMLRQSPETVLDPIKQYIESSLDGFKVELPVTHVFASIEEAESSSILLDLVTLISHVFRVSGRQTRLLLHLALPNKQLNRDNSRDWACYFAVIREIRRFIVNNNNYSYMIYPHGSGLEMYNPGAGSPIYSLKTYLFTNYQELVANWTDIILPQLDALSSGMGVRYQQHNIVNWHAGVQNNQVIENVGDSELITGTYVTKSVVLPLHKLQPYWTSRLSYAFINEWLGESFDKTIAIQKLEGDWLLKDTRVKCPYIAYWALFMAQYATIEKQTLPELQDIFFAGNLKNIVLGRDGNENIKIIDWTPPFEVVETGISPREYIAILETKFEDIFGSFNVLSDQNNAYVKALNYFTTDIVKNFHGSLLNWVQWALGHGYGIRQLYGLLTDYVDKPLSELEKRLASHVMHSQRNIRSDNLNDQFNRAGRRIIRFKNLLGRKTAELIYFEEVAQYILEKLKGFYTLKAVHQCVLQFKQIIKSLVNEIDHWRKALWEPTTLHDSLLTKLYNAIEQPDLESLENRLWLASSQWVESQYHSMQLALFDNFQSNLSWNIPSVDTLNLYMNTDNSSSLQLSSQVDAVEFNVEKVLGSIRSWVEKQNISLVDYLSSLNEDHKYNEIFNGLRVLTSPDDFQDSAITQDMLLFPVNIESSSAGYFTNELRFHLTGDSNVIDILSSSDSTRITRYIAHEMFPLNETSVYETAKSAYSALGPQQRIRLQVLPAEVEAVRYELHIQDLFHTEDILFSSSITALFSHIERLRLFVWLEALQFIKLYAYNITENRYVLQLPSGEGHEIWWLTRSPYSRSRLGALNAVVLFNGALPYGEEPNIKLPIPLHTLPQMIDEIIESESQYYPVEQSQQRHWKLANRHQHKLEEARAIAMAAQIALDYRDEMKHHWENESGNEDERNTYAILAVIAQQLYDEKLELLRDKFS